LTTVGAVVERARMRWRLVYAYGSQIAIRELLRCQRWSPEDRARTAFVVSILGGMIAAPVVLVSLAWWLLTGGGPIRWFRLSRRPVVKIFRGPLTPPEVDAALERLGKGLGEPACSERRADLAQADREARVEQVGVRRQQPPAEPLGDRGV